MAVRAVMHGAMALYLARYLNVPPARIPGEGGEQLDDLPADPETIRATRMRWLARIVLVTLLLSTSVTEAFLPLFSQSPVSGLSAALRFTSAEVPVYWFAAPPGEFRPWAISSRAQPVKSRRGAREESGLLGRRGTAREPLERIEQHRVAARALVDGKVALEHAAVGAERLDAGLDIGPPGVRQLTRRRRQRR